MKIYGIGTDIANINRLRKSLKSKTFINRLFNKNEIDKCSKQINKENCYSKRFAAKEAFAKALGTGFRNNLNFKDIEIMNDKFGKPYYSKTKKISQLIRKQFNVKNFKCFLSISDEKEYSTAFTIIQSI